MRFTRFFFSFTLFIVLSSNLLAQIEIKNLYPPLKEIRGLSGLFGEMRATNIHAGLDFRTGGRIGHEVFSSEVGYVARIKVSSVGYGKALYVAHPNGLTTVYAHMHKFSDKIENWLKDQQYEKESFEIDLHLLPKNLPIGRGEVIGISGNTGSSGGPHLHYEVRITSNQEIINPSFSNLKIHNTFAPTIRGAWLYSLTNDPSPYSIDNRVEIAIQSKGNNSFFSADTIHVNSDVALGIEAYDFVNSMSLRCGIYGIKMYVNDSLFYHYQMDQYAFNESGYAKSHIDYALWYETGKRAHKLFLEPNNKLRAYKTIQNNGLLSFDENNISRVIIEAFDAHNHTANLSLVLKKIDKKESKVEVLAPPEHNNKYLWPYFQPNTFSSNAFTITAPANALFNSIYFNYSISDTVSHEIYSQIISLHSPTVPLLKNYTLHIATPDLPDTLKPKALIATRNEKNNKTVAIGGTYDEVGIKTNYNYFGEFFVVIDTIPPSVELISPPANANFSKRQGISFKITDELSGITEIEGTIDGKWVLFEYDKKNDSIFYEFDESRLPKNKSHKLQLRVSDARNNTSYFEYWFTR